MVSAPLTCTTLLVLRREPFFLPFYSPCILTPSPPVTSGCCNVRMILCFVILTANFLTRGAGRRPLSAYSADHGLILNTIKCVECLFYSQNTSSQLPLFLMNGEVLSREQTVKYLGVHFTSKMAWYTHIDTVCTKCLKPSFLSEGSAQ